MSLPKSYHGVVVPMVTPFTEDGRLDEAAVPRVIDHLLDGGIHGLLLLGTTGEGTSVTRTDRLRLVERVAARVNGRTRLYANVSGTCFEESVEAAEAYCRAGIEVLAAHLPCYYPLDAVEMETYFAALADRVPAPLFLYNIPMTTHMSIPIEVVEALSRHPNIVGIKDSEYDPGRHETLIGRMNERDDFAFFVGPSAYAARGMTLGADGFVPGVGNVIPEACRQLYESAVHGDTKEAERCQVLIRQIGDTYGSGRSIAQSITMLKVAMHTLGVCGPAVLPPLREPGEAERREMAERIRRVLDHATAETHA